MASAVIQGGTSLLRLNSGTHVLPIASLAASSAVTQVGNAVQIGALGVQQCSLTFQMAANSKSVLTRIQVWNASTATEAVGVNLTAPGASSSGNHFTVELPFTVSDSTHQFQFRLIVADALNPNRVTVFVPNFQANLRTSEAGSFSVPVTEVTVALYNVSAADVILHVTRTLTGPSTIVIPTAGTINNRMIEIKDGGLNATANNITINTEGAELIEGQPNALINTDGEALTLYAYGGNWFVW